MGKRCLTLKLVACLTMQCFMLTRAIIGSMCDNKTIRVNIHVSHNRETMSDAENSWLPVDAVLRDDESDDGK